MRILVPVLIYFFCSYSVASPPEVSEIYALNCTVLNLSDKTAAHLFLLKTSWSDSYCLGTLDISCKPKENAPCRMMNTSHELSDISKRVTNGEIIDSLFVSPIYYGCCECCDKKTVKLPKLRDISEVVIPDETEEMSHALGDRPAKTLRILYFDTDITPELKKIVDFNRDHHPSLPVIP
ncbi:hypothetical protein [Endozoicomonas sp. Mp262]|uniref:hypothetical protein n=1 Tax=Endozoicomonas sp. Mp262 TaxID=2919499 RepID=UPI0021DA24AD